MIKEVRIGFSTSRGIVSAAIRKVTRSKYSHAWVSFRDETLGKVVVMHATRYGYKIEPWRRFVRHVKLGPQFRMERDLTTGIRYVADWLGTMYDFPSILGFLWVALKRWIGKKIRNPFRSSRWLFCSEAVVLILQKSAVVGSHLLDKDSTDPQALLEFMHASSEASEVLQ